MIREVAVKQNLNWRSWWAGGPDGDIPQQWQVTGWPTIFVIDAQGIVRQRLTSAHDLDRIIEALVRDAERG